MPKKLAKNTRLISILFLVVNTLTWGAALPIVKPSLSLISPFEFLFYRYLFAALFSLPFLFYLWPKVPHKSQAIMTIIPMELLGTTIALSLLYFGLEKTTSIEASLIATTTPIFITIGGVLFLREKEELHEWWGLWLAVLGTLMLTLEPIFRGSIQLSSFMHSGNVLVFIQNVAITCYFLLAKRLYKGIPKLFITTLSFYVGLISFFFLSVLEMRNVLVLDVSEFVRYTIENVSQPAVLLATLYMAIFGSIIGLTAYIKGQDGIEASEASIFTYLQPLVFLPLRVFMLKEQLSIWSIISVVLIFFGVFLAEIRIQHKR